MTNKLDRGRDRLPGPLIFLTAAVQVTAQQQLSFAVQILQKASVLIRPMLNNADHDGFFNLDGKIPCQPDGAQMFRASHWCIRPSDDV